MFELGPGSGSQWNELWTYDIAADSAFRLFAEAASIGNGRVSADGRHIAYVSALSGRNEIYVRSFPQAGVAVRITSDGGTAPRWLSDGRLTYIHEGSLRAVRLSTGGAPTAGAHETLIPAGIMRGLDRAQFILSPDASEFTAVVQRGDGTADNRITVVFDWWALLEERRGLLSRPGSSGPR